MAENNDITFEELTQMVSVSLDEIEREEKVNIVVFDNNAIFNTYSKYLDGNTNIVAISDNGISVYGILMDSGMRICPMWEIKNLEFDYVVIFSNENVRQTIQILSCVHSVPLEKIVGWKDYLRTLGAKIDYYIDDNFYEHSLSICNTLPNVLVDYHCWRVFDYGMGLAEMGVKGLEYFEDFSIGCRYFELYGVDDGINTLPGYSNLYNRVYKEDEFMTMHIDMVLLMDAFLKYSYDEIYNIVEKIQNCTRYIMINIPFPSYKLKVWNCSGFEKFGKVINAYTNNDEHFIIIDTGKDDYREDIKLYVVTHKDFLPIYDVQTDKMRIPIFAGAALQAPIEGFLRDDAGDNISRYNPYINEFTAIYWVWKHTKSKYVGFEHYRRAFSVNSYNAISYSVLSENEILRYLDYEKYDFIAVRPTYNAPKTNGRFMREHLEGELYDRCYKKLKHIIEKVQPEYLDAFDKCFLHTSSFYPCNMFITKWEYFNDYCEFVFSILLNVVDEADLVGYNTYNKRVWGFFGERLLTVWLYKHDLRIKEIYHMINVYDEKENKWDVKIVRCGG